MLHADLFTDESKTPRVGDAEVLIEFDGGTPCNVPSLGYGEGYGSFRIDRGAVVRVKHGRPMSSNVAEIATLICAVERVKLECSSRRLRICGDSQIALKWAAPGRKRLSKSGKASPDFRAVVAALGVALDGCEVVVEWKRRDHNVRIFGH